MANVHVSNALSQRAQTGSLEGVLLYNAGSYDIGALS
jgi:hypothetical protein